METDFLSDNYQYGKCFQVFAEVEYLYYGNRKSGYFKTLIKKLRAASIFSFPLPGFICRKIRFDSRRICR